VPNQNITELKPQQIPFGTSVTAEGLVYLNAVGEKDFPVAYLLVAKNYEQPLNESKTKLFFQAFPLVFVVLAAAIFASFRMNSRLLTPLIRLSDFTRRVESSGDYSMKHQVQGLDEVSNLTHDINTLLGKINRETQLNRKQTETLEQQRASMQHMANYDALTGIPNRMFFMDLLRTELAKRKARQENLAILFFDVDEFKGVNDRLGHETGDQLLVSICEAVKSCLGKDDILARLSGDEFLVLIPKLDRPMLAEHTATRIIEKLEKPFHIRGWEVQTGVSLGIAKAKESDYEINTFISNADIAMYESKGKGKGGYTVFNQKLLHENLRKQKIASLLSHAVALNEFTLHYQIKISNVGKVNGLEALLRWNNKDLGKISPAEFIPIAEQGGKIRVISEWVATQVLRDMQELQSIFDNTFVVSFNVSSYDLRDSLFLNFFSQKLNEFSVCARQIQLEITETSYLVDFDKANDFFKAVRQMGASIALDDFGTGYSSLSYLTKIEIDTLKIDRSFISSYESSSRDESVLQTIFDLAMRMEFKVCSEGVETPEQARFLISQGGQQMQGYYFARPAPINELANAITLAEQKFQQLL